MNKDFFDNIFKHDTLLNWYLIEILIYYYSVFYPREDVSGPNQVVRLGFQSRQPTDSKKRI